MDLMIAISSGERYGAGTLSTSSYREYRSRLRRAWKRALIATQSLGAFYDDASGVLRSD